MRFRVYLMDHRCPTALLAEFHFQDAAEKWARQLRNQIRKDIANGKLWHVDEVAVQNKDTSKWLTMFEVKS